MAGPPLSQANSGDSNPSSRRSARRWWLHGILLTVLTVALLMPDAALGSFLSRVSFDLMTRWTARVVTPAENSLSVLVFIDLESHLRLKQDPAQGWDRGLHARLIRRLTRAGARAIVFDVLFGGPGPSPEADEALRQAIQENGRVILAGEMNRSSRNTMVTTAMASQAVQAPWERFASAAAGWGVADLEVDEDFVPRRIFRALGPIQRLGLSWTVNTYLRGPSTVAIPQSDGSPQWIRYRHPPLGTPHVGYAEALESESVPDDFFRDKVVWIGAKPMAGSFRDRRDEFPSPFGHDRERELFIPGVEVHAAAFDSLQRNDALSRLDSRLEIWLFVLSGWAWVAVFSKLRVMTGAWVALVAVVGVTAVAVELWIQPGIWFCWMGFCGAHIPMAYAMSVVGHGVEWYALRRAMEAERRRANETIREQALLIEKARDCILVLGLTGVPSYMNPAAAKIFGGTKNWSDEFSYHPTASGTFGTVNQPSAVEVLNRVIQTGEWLGEMVRTEWNGIRRIYQARWTLIRGSIGEQKSVLVMLTDMTEQKSLENQLFRADREKSIGSLVNGIAHDLNNSLSPILVGIEVLRRRGIDLEAERVLSMMESSTLRGSDMLRQMLHFSRGDEGARELITPASLVHEVERVIRPILPQGIQLHIAVPEDSWMLEANPTQLFQVLLNLLINARDALPQGGQITLAADNFPVVATANPDSSEPPPGDYVVFMVSDTGEGISSSILPRIFEPYFSTKSPGHGSGLGLATVRRIVEQHGGFVSVRTAAGEGTVFEVVFPAITHAGNVTREVLGASNDLEGGDTLIWLRGNRSLTEMIERCLADEGIRSIRIPDENQLELWIEASSDSRLIVLDADGIPGGFHALERRVPGLRHRTLLLLTSESNPRDPDLWGDVGKRWRFLTKPVHPKELREALRDLLTSSHPNP